MLDSSSVSQFVSQSCPLQPVKIIPLRAGNNRMLCRLEDSTGRSWVLRMQHQEEPTRSWLTRFILGTRRDTTRETFTALAQASSSLHGVSPSPYPEFSRPVVGSRDREC